MAGEESTIVSGYAEFQSDIEGAINRNSIDAMLNTPDYVLAELIVDFVKALQKVEASRAYMESE